MRLLFLLLLLLPNAILASDTLDIKRLNLSVGLNSGFSKNRNSKGLTAIINNELGTYTFYSSTDSQIGINYGFGVNAGYSLINSVSLEGSLSLNKRTRSFLLSSRVLLGDLANQTEYRINTGRITQKELTASTCLGFSFNMSKNKKIRFLFGGFLDHYIDSENLWRNKRTDFYDIDTQMEITPPVSVEKLLLLASFKKSSGIYTGFRYGIGKEEKIYGNLSLIIYTELRKKGVLGNILNGIQNDYFVLQVDYFLR